jgi:hypothetical protein
VVVDGPVEGAAEPGQGLGHVLLDGDDPLVGHHQVALGVVVLGLGDDALLEELLLALELAAVELDVVLNQPVLGLLLLVGSAQRRNLVAGGIEVGLGAGDGDEEGLAVEAEEKLAGLEAVVLVDGDIDDAPRDVGADGDLVGLDVGVLGGGVAGRDRIVVGTGNRQRHRAAHRQHGQRQGAAETAAAVGPGGDRRGCGVGFAHVIPWFRWRHRHLRPRPWNRWPGPGRGCP